MSKKKNWKKTLLYIIGTIIVVFGALLYFAHIVNMKQNIYNMFSKPMATKYGVLKIKTQPYENFDCDYSSCNLGETKLYLDDAILGVSKNIKLTLNSDNYGISIENFIISKDTYEEFKLAYDTKALGVTSELDNIYNALTPMNLKLYATKVDTDNINGKIGYKTPNFDLVVDINYLNSDKSNLIKNIIDKNNISSIKVNFINKNFFDTFYNAYVLNQKIEASSMSNSNTESSKSLSDINLPKIYTKQEVLEKISKELEKFKNNQNNTLFNNMDAKTLKDIVTCLTRNNSVLYFNVNLPKISVDNNYIYKAKCTF
jgi:hypothetical protein